jgi:hypothetical protein
LASGWGAGYELCCEIEAIGSELDCDALQRAKDLERAAECRYIRQKDGKFERIKVGEIEEAGVKEESLGGGGEKIDFSWLPLIDQTTSKTRGSKFTTLYSCCTAGARFSATA